MPFYIITLDFIIDLPPTRDSYLGKTFNSILVIMDKLTKYAYYILTTKNVTAVEFTEIMWREFIAYNGVIRNIISNRGSLFTSQFWAILYY